MSENKENLIANLMADFDKHGGGTEVDLEYTTKNPDALKEGLQKSFDSIFPELMKKSKHRKHVIFDDDIFKFFGEISDGSGTGFSSLINSALRSYIRERLLNTSKNEDPVAKLLGVRELERELLKEIKELNLTEELNKKLG